MIALSPRAIRALTDLRETGGQIDLVDGEVFVLGKLDPSVDWRLDAFRSEILEVLEWWLTHPAPPPELWS